MKYPVNPYLQQEGASYLIEIEDAKAFGKLSNVLRRTARESK